MENQNTPLRVKIKNDKLVIEIGTETLAFGFNNSDDNNPFDHEKNKHIQQFYVSNRKIFAEDVRRELIDEEEDGTTPLDLLFDKVTMLAVENGTAGVRESKGRANLHQPTGRCAKVDIKL